MHSMSENKHISPGGAEFSTCVNASLRRATRSVGRVYDRALKPAGLRATQFTLLATLAGNEAIPLTRLAEITATDRTTLSRNLKPLVAKKWVSIDRDQDERFRMVSITPGGRAKIAEAGPLWRVAQSQVTEILSPPQVRELRQLLGVLTDQSPG